MAVIIKMMNKKGAIGIIFLVISLLIVASGLIVTVNKIQKDYNKNNIAGTELNSEFIQNDFSSLGSSSNKDFDSFSNYFSGGGGGSGSSGSSGSSSSNNPNKDSQNINLLEGYEPNYEEFNEIEINDKTVFFQQRMIGDAIVEKDFKVYQFDTDSKEFVKKIINWNDDLPEYLPPEITKEEAELIAKEIVKGEVQFSKLYIISPDSDVFPIEPPENHPCWIVAIVNEYGYIDIIIIDAVTGEKLGYGIPPPSNAFSLSGPQFFNPCNGTWDRWSNNAEYWFNEMHYDTENIGWPTENEVKSHIQSNETVLFYEVAHGNSFMFESGCGNSTNSSEIETWSSEIELWITDYEKMPFTFLASCDAMCETGDDTLSYEFRKSDDEDTATVGYCNMSGSDCSSCWGNSVQWQDMFFEYLKGGAYTVEQAFDIANSNYPMCFDYNCMRFEGDGNLKLVTCDEDYGNNYCCEYNNESYTCRNITCHNLAGVSFTKPYSLDYVEKCGEDEYGDNYCYDDNVYRNFTDRGCSGGGCFENTTREIVETCEHGCDNGECTYPDLVVENPYFSKIEGTKVWLVFTIKNIGNAIANPVYWMVDTNSSNDNPNMTEPTLNPGKSILAGFKWDYMQPGNYTSNVIVDFGYLINESDEGNNEASILVSI